MASRDEAEIMLSKLAVTLWRLIRDGVTARGGRYWPT
jgi:hypothetical protein